MLEAEGLRLAITTDKEQEEVKKLLDSVGYLQELELKELESTDKCSFWPKEPAAPELVPDATPIVPQVEKSPGEPQLWLKAAPPSPMSPRSSACGWISWTG